MTLKIIIEGWRFLPHSYAIVNQFQLLELKKRRELEIYHRDAPFYQPHWQQVKGLFSPEEEEILASIPPSPPNLKADAIYRISFPYNLENNCQEKVYTFGTSEFSTVPARFLKPAIPLLEALAQNQVEIITPSEWSRKGFISSGADPARLHVVPHGVDTAIFKPLPENERENLRRQLGWHDYFIYLHTGSMTGNKGIGFILESAAEIASETPEIRVVLKGLGSLYASRQFVDTCLESLPKTKQELIRPRIVFTDNTFTFTEMAQLYQAADCYISPYLGEGFNMPVMEACACGLPAICSEGGPTDEFTHREFTMRIRTRKRKSRNEILGTFTYLEPDREHLRELMRNIIVNRYFRQQARKLGPQFMNRNFTWRHIIDRLLESIFPKQKT